jgi:small conductance mechanosensitive channel
MNLDPSSIDWAQTFADLSPLILSWGVKIIGALLLLFIGMSIVGHVAGLVRKAINSQKRIDQTLGNFVASLIRYAGVAIVFIIVLGVFGIEIASLASILAAATLAIGLALQGTLGHLAAGVMLVFFRPFNLGDFVEIGGESGTVHELNLFFAALHTADNVRIIIPNGAIWGQPITNYSANPERRCDIDFGISYESDIETAIKAILDTCAADGRFLDAPAGPWVRVTSLADSAVNLQFRGWVKSADYWEARFAMMRHVKEAFDRSGVDIPYPHTTIVQKT